MIDQRSVTTSKIGQLFIGDNLDVMRNDIPSSYADLIYLDPPFNSKRNYNCNFKDESQTFGFEDTWDYLRHKEATDKEYERMELGNTKLSQFLKFVKSGSIKDNNHFAYLTFMSARLQEMHRILKPSGSIYLHIDPTESHYLKIVMDIVFGVENFRNEIVWCYTGSQNAQRYFQCKHDIILFYSKTNKYYFNDENIRIPFNETSKYYIDSDGKKYTKKCGKIYYVKHDGKIPEDYWIDINRLHHIASERLGYPTQKPEALLDRIISASCPEDGVLLDPFCGCGTSCAVAAKKQIRYIGIDITSKAKEVIRKRFSDAGLSEPEIIDRPSNVVEAARLAASDKYGSQRETMKKLGLINHDKKGADGGVDGHQNYRLSDGTIFKVIAENKAGGATLGQLRGLVGVIARENADVGVFAINESPTKAMLQEADRHGFYRNNINGDRIPKIQILVLEEVWSNRKTIKLPEGAKVE